MAEFLALQADRVALPLEEMLIIQGEMAALLVGVQAVMRGVALSIFLEPLIMAVMLIPAGLEVVVMLEALALAEMAGMQALLIIGVLVAAQMALVEVCRGAIQF